MMFNKYCVLRSLSSCYKGYIPNSVIRKQLGYRPPTPPQIQKRQAVWRPKPVSIWQREREKSYELLTSILIYMYFLPLSTGSKAPTTEGGWRRGSDGFIWGKLNSMEWENPSQSFYQFQYVQGLIFVFENFSPVYYYQ